MLHNKDSLLNRDKTKEIISACRKRATATASPGHSARDVFARSRRHREQQADRRRLRRNTAVVDSCSHMLYAMRGLPDTSLQNVFRAVIVSRVEYAAPAWVRVCTVSSFFSFRPVSGKTKYDILDRFSHSACIKNKKAVLSQR